MASGSVAHYCLSNISANSRALGHCKWYGCSLLVKCRNTWKSTHSLLGEFMKCPPMGFFYVTMVYLMLPASIYVRNMSCAWYCWISNSKNTYYIAHVHSWELITNLRAKKVCHHAKVAKTFLCCNQKLHFLQCDWWREIFLQKVNEAREIGQMSTSPSPLGMGSVTRLMWGSPEVVSSAWAWTSNLASSRLEWIPSSTSIAHDLNLRQCYWTKWAGPVHTSSLMYVIWQFWTPLTYYSLSLIVCLNFVQTLCVYLVWTFF